jgi:ABC exporter DevB family membrane fusion protein
MKKARAAAAGGLIVLVATAYLASSKGDGEAPAPMVLPQGRYVAAEGKVETLPGFKVEVGSDLITRIEQFLVKEGDLVEKGRVIVTLESRDVRAKLREAQGELAVARARLREIRSRARDEEIQKAAAAIDRTLADVELARTDLDRYRNLYGKGMVSRSSVDERERAYRIATARVREAEEEKRLLEKGAKRETVKLQEETVVKTEATVEYYSKLLARTVITAPISGKVIRKYLEEGEVVIPETPLAAIADVERIRVSAEVDETDVGRIQVGDSAEVTSYAYPGRVFQGTVEEIADVVGVRQVRPNNPAVNLGLKVVQVRIGLLEKTPLKLGMTVDVKVTPKRD